MPSPSDRSEAVPLGTREIALAYRLVLRREVDEEGLAAYRDAASRGLTLAELLAALLASNEYRDLVARPRPADGSPPLPAPPETDGLITPADVLQRYTLEELNATAEDYYRRLGDATSLMAKPFASWNETPQMLQDLGAVFQGLHLGRMMTVLDFGGGTGWLSRLLVQLHCQPICCDVSESALRIGRRLFEEHPVMGLTVHTPRFLLFDGLRIDLPDASVDRIVCFDAFHHVPNPDVVLAEFGRVLREGGIAGFSEPGRHHSQSRLSQFEMRYRQVLENDIDLAAIFAMAQPAGFTRLTLRALSDVEMSLDDYRAMSDTDDAPTLADRLWSNTRETMASRSVFFLHKGPRRLDSRSSEGLGATILVQPGRATTTPDEPVRFQCTLVNSGQATWIAHAPEIFGIVRLGIHLADASGRLIDEDFARFHLPESVEPGGRLEMAIAVSLPAAGDFLLTFDLVAEGVAWFEFAGEATTCLVPVSVVDQPGT